MKRQKRRSDTCRLCGRPLEDTEEELCSACRAVSSAKERVIRPEKVRRARRRMNGTTRVMLITVCVLAVVLAALVTASTLLYNKYDPQKFLAQLDSVLASGDAAALVPLLESDELSVSEEGAQALCLAFAQESDRAALRGQLDAQRVDPNAAGAYPALRLVKKPAFLGYGRYALGVQSVSVLLQAPARELRLSLNGVPCRGERTADGLLYENIFPGQYNCAAAGVTAAGQPVVGGVTVLRLLDTEPVLFDGAMPVAHAVISGCLSDAAVISVDGAIVGYGPENGTVTLPQVAVGSTVSMRYTAPWGAVTTASVVVPAAGDVQLAFTDHVTQGGVPNADELTPLATIFCSSYLDAINNQDPARILGCTENGRACVNPADGSEYQTGHVFVFDGVSVAASVAGETVDGLPRVTCCIRMDYRIVNRKTSEEATLADYGRCTFTWQDGWLLDVYAPADEAAFTAANAAAQG